MNEMPLDPPEVYYGSEKDADSVRVNALVKQKSMTMCRKCAFKFHLSAIFEQAKHRVLAGQGSDSLCDFCNKENGGAVIYISSA